MPTVLRGGRVVDPMNGVDEWRDVAFADGYIIAAGAVAEARVIDVQGYVVTPGLIDLHTHLRDPGQTAKEDVSTGTRAAAAGGFSTVVMMPNTVPRVDSCERLSYAEDLIREKGRVKVEPTVALTSESGGERVCTDLPSLRNGGAVAATDDGGCVQTNALMLEALRWAKCAEIPILDHCEDVGISKHGSLNEGAIAHEFGLAGQSQAAEEVMVARDIVLASHTGWPVHIQHVSTAGSVGLIREAKERGVPVTAEATPHHLALTEEMCREKGTHAKVNPPLRKEKDRMALQEGLKEGTIRVIATDHAPHTAADKNTTFEKAAFGIAGLESALPVCLSVLYHGERMPLFDVISAFTRGPEAVLNTGRGSLSDGAPADISILAPDEENVIDVSGFESKGRNSPFDARQCRGAVKATIVDGLVVKGNIDQRECS